MVKFHFGLGGDDDASNNEGKNAQEVVATEDSGASTGAGSTSGQTPVGNMGDSAGSSTTPPPTEEPVSSEPVIEKIQEPVSTEEVSTKDDVFGNPFQTSQQAEQNEDSSTKNEGKGVQSAVPTPTESPVFPTENPFGEAQPVVEVPQDQDPVIPKPVFAEPNSDSPQPDTKAKETSSDVFTPVAEGSIAPKEISSVDAFKNASQKFNPTDFPAEKIETPAVTEVKKEIPSIPKSEVEVPTNTNGSSSSTTHDPAQTVKQVKIEIESYVKVHKQKIKQYQDQINDLNEKIKQEKIELRKKHDEFANLLKEMNDLTKDFGGDNNGNSAPQKPYRPQSKR